MAHFVPKWHKVCGTGCVILAQSVPGRRRLYRGIVVGTILAIHIYSGGEVIAMGASYKLVLRNDLHSTQAAVIVNDGQISNKAIRRAERVLCGMADCYCGGIRGPQDKILERCEWGIRVL